MQVKELWSTISPDRAGRRLSYASTVEARRLITLLLLTGGIIPFISLAVVRSSLAFEPIYHDLWLLIRYFFTKSRSNYNNLAVGALLRAYL